MRIEKMRIEKENLNNELTAMPGDMRHTATELLVTFAGTPLPGFSVRDRKPQKCQATGNMRQLRLCTASRESVSISGSYRLRTLSLHQKASGARESVSALRRLAESKSNPGRKVLMSNKNLSLSQR